MTTTRAASPLEFSNQYPHCALPLRIDPYLGCDHGCTYCYANASRSALKRVGAGMRVRSGEALVAELDRVVAGDWARCGGEALLHGMVLRLGVMGDPFCSAEREHRSTRAVLEWAAKQDRPVTVTSKGALLVAEHARLLARPGSHTQISISTLDDAEAARLEPTAPPPSARLAAVEAVAELGGFVTVRLAPLVPWLRSGREPGPVMRAIARAGARHVMVEHLKIPRNRVKAVGAALGFDPMAYFGKGRGGVVGTMWTLWLRQRLANVVAFRRAAHEAGLSFGCGDNDMKIANDSLCCCGTDLALGREAVHHPMTMRALEVIRERGAVAFDDLNGDWLPTARINASRRVARSSAIDTTPWAIQRAVWNEDGLSLYGVRRLADRRFAFDPSVRFFAELTAPLVPHI